MARTVPVRISRRKVMAASAGLVVLLAVLAGLNVEKIWERLGAGPVRIRSIAVLPLKNLSGDAEQDYFADGMTEALITDLGKIGALRVISRRSVMRYRGSDKPLPEIARELNVDAVLDGSTLRSGDQVRITAQLINAATEEHLGADRYERELRDVLSLQNEIVVAIAREIELQLTPAQDQTRLARARLVNPEAHEAYLKGSVPCGKVHSAGPRDRDELLPARAGERPQLRHGLRRYRQGLDLVSADGVCAAS